MMADTIFSREIEILHALRVTPGDIRGIARFLDGMGGTTRWKGTCSDGTSIAFTNIEELLAYENPSFRRLQTVSAEVFEQSNAYFPFLSLILSATPYRPSASVAVKHVSLPMLAQVEAELPRWLREMKPWDSFLRRFDWAWALPGVFFIGGLVFLISLAVVHAILSMLGSGKVFAQGKEDPVWDPLISVSPYLVGLILWGIGYGFDRFKARYLGRVVFLWGKQVEEDQRGRYLLYSLLGLSALLPALKAILLKLFGF